MIFILPGCFGHRQKVISGLEGQKLPSFSLLLTDSITRLNTSDIPLGQPFVLFYFNPHCPFCRAQTQELKDEMKSVENVRFYFLSGYPLYQIREFDNHYGLSRYTNITILQIKDTAFTNYFKIPGVPYIAVYNKQKHLKEVLLGKVSISNIRSVILDN
jgi:thiol-disulfide isomerase/thioredoxin